jgi:hypothetical protein
MPFIWDWIWEKLSGIGKITAQPQGVGRPEMDYQVWEKVVRNRRKISAKKSNTGSKSTGIRSNNKSKTGGESTGKAVRAPAKQNKTKGKAV